MYYKILIYLDTITGILFNSWLFSLNVIFIDLKNDTKVGSCVVDICRYFCRCIRYCIIYYSASPRKRLNYNHMQWVHTDWRYNTIYIECTAHSCTFDAELKRYTSVHMNIINVILHVLFMDKIIFHGII